MASITLTVQVAWLVRWYISGVALFAMLTGLEPDMEKITAKVMKGVRLS